MDLNLWVMIGAGVFGVVGGIALKMNMHKLTPMQKYARMAAKAEKYDRANWVKFEKEMLKNIKEKHKKGLTGLMW